MKNIKVVISAGGVGNSLSQSTGWIAPKSLRSILGRPLISYQLEDLLSFGVSDIFISFNTPRQLDLFRRMTHMNMFPKHPYVYGMHPYGHPLNTFFDSNALSFVHGSSFLWSWGDVFYNKFLLKKLFRVFKKNDTSVCCSSSLDNPFIPRIDKKYLVYRKNVSSKVIDCSLENYSGQKDFGLHVPLLLKKISMKHVLSLLKSPETDISLSKLLLTLVETKQLSVVVPDTLVNVNTLDDVKFLIKKLSSGSRNPNTKQKPKTAN